jgi:hypothetical protein
MSTALIAGALSSYYMEVVPGVCRGFNAGLVILHIVRVPCLQCTFSVEIIE